MMPSRSHTGTPSIAFDGFRHFTSSTMSGSASLIRLLIRASVSPRQSLSSLILASISREGEPALFSSFAPLFLFMVAVAFFMVVSPVDPYKLFSLVHTFCSDQCTSRQTSFCPRQHLLQLGEELLPSGVGAPISLLLIGAEARLLHAQVSPR